MEGRAHREQAIPSPFEIRHALVETPKQDPGPSHTRLVCSTSGSSRFVSLAGACSRARRQSHLGSGLFLGTTGSRSHFPVRLSGRLRRVSAFNYPRESLHEEANTLRGTAASTKEARDAEQHALEDVWLRHLAFRVCVLTSTAQEDLLILSNGTGLPPERNSPFLSQDRR